MGNTQDEKRKERVFSGIQPSGDMHLGNYLGAVKNWVAMASQYDCIYCVVDIHALTTTLDTSNLQLYIHDIVLDWLAAGMDPEKSIIFVQSHVPEVMELHTLLSICQGYACGKYVENDLF